MSLGELQTEADLLRWLQQKMPALLPGPAPDVSLIKNGVPSDDDFPKPPRDGTTAVDESGPTLYCRIGGEWVAL